MLKLIVVLTLIVVASFWGIKSWNDSVCKSNTDFEISIGKHGLSACGKSWGISQKRDQTSYLCTTSHSSKTHEPYQQTQMQTVITQSSGTENGKRKGYQDVQIATEVEISCGENGQYEEVKTVTTRSRSSEDEPYKETQKVTKRTLNAEEARNFSKSKNKKEEPRTSSEKDIFTDIDCFSIEGTIKQGAKQLEQIGKILASHMAAQGALHKAVCAGQVAIVEQLVKEGADLLVLDDAGNTPLHWAVFTGHIEMVKLFLESSRQSTTLLKTPNKCGNTALCYAVWTDQREIAKLLLKGGADLSAANEAGNTPLHCAVYTGQAEMVRLLLENAEHVQAALEAVNNAGYTAQRCAEIAGQAAIVQLLQEASDRH